MGKFQRENRKDKEDKFKFFEENKVEENWEKESHKKRRENNLKDKHKKNRNDYRWN